MRGNYSAPLLNCLPTCSPFIRKCATCLNCTGILMTSPQDVGTPHPFSPRGMSVCVCVCGRAGARYGAMGGDDNAAKGRHGRANERAKQGAVSCGDNFESYRKPSTCRFKYNYPIKCGPNPTMTTTMTTICFRCGGRFEGNSRAVLTYVHVVVPSASYHRPNGGRRIASFGAGGDREPLAAVEGKSADREDLQVGSMCRPGKRALHLPHQGNRAGLGRLPEPR